MGWDGMGWVGMGWDGVGWCGMRWVVMKWSVMGWGGVAWVWVPYMCVCGVCGLWFVYGGCVAHVSRMMACLARVVRACGVCIPLVLHAVREVHVSVVFSGCVAWACVLACMAFVTAAAKAFA